MPIPKPSESEEKEAFISRCMGALAEEYKDDKQRAGICYTSWRESKKTDEHSEEYEVVTKTHLKTVKLINKSMDGSFIIGGYANVYMLDKDGKVVPDYENEVVTLDALEEAIQVLMAKESRRNHMYYHTNIQIGELLWEAVDGEGVPWKTQVIREPDEQYSKKGLFILSRVYDDTPVSLEIRDTMEKNGEMLSFSIGGVPMAKEHKCDEDKCWNEITKLYLAEVSSCDEGMNAESKAFILKQLDEDALLTSIVERIVELEKTLLK